MVFTARITVGVCIVKRSHDGKACLWIRLGVSKTRRLRHLSPCLAEAEWGERRLKAERAWFLDRRERRAKPETEPLLTRWGKSGVLSIHSAVAIHTVFSTPSLILIKSQACRCI
jgi:hypothetical protein